MFVSAMVWPADVFDVWTCTFTGNRPVVWARTRHPASREATA